MPYYRINHKIQAPEVRLVGTDEEYIGVVSLNEALKQAEEAGLDLVEISPKAEPPVVKITDFGSFKYNLQKQNKKNKITKESKGIRLSPRIGEHDLSVKIEQTQKFIEKNYKVKIEMLLKGREKAHKDIAQDIITGFIKNLGENIEIEQPLTHQGHKFITVIKKK
ncbi:MAG: translation initiation factor IF-3 [Patescibacteria group bacterium]|nr:translation initiation factor IF-3 [Patescibacteria group bacterium]